MKNWFGRLFVFGMLLMTLTACGAINSPSQKPHPQSKPSKTKPAQKPAAKPTAAPTADADKFVQTGTAQLNNGDVNQAIASFKKALKANPKHAKAAQQLQQAEQKKADLIDEHLRRGIAYFNGDQLEQAMQEWKQVLALDADHAKALDYKQRTQVRLDALRQKK